MDQETPSRQSAPASQGQQAHSDRYVPLPLTSMDIQKGGSTGWPIGRWLWSLLHPTIIPPD